MTATLIQSPDRVIFQNISWQTYQSLIKDFDSEPAIRLTYDRGTLEIRKPLDPHESYRKILGRLIEAATEELDLEIRSLGSRTGDREDLKKGLEPDQCYYIQNEAQVRDIEQIDLAYFPPPDLAVEVDITSSSLDRFSIYAELGIPEIWRYDAHSLAIYTLSEGQYRICAQSIALSPLKATDITRFLELRFPKSEAKTAVGENSLIKQFRQWLGSQ
ncbi:Uma2 family endonuclease [Romeria aff. gracilis LEGE 07310]|uniref:Uma2 family endonuclease n=1 Tax=Vasconcelosia minhoensis LEGE 07310 TaxID=915328 RepID=A0A8J7AG01_9CYAN|nr:Uma2 family endonuclease [Romeria gracilis]MBE9076813.1 Uma2 family endonuclease [Romeria aff. gracilis LEGE 07310]